MFVKCSTSSKSVALQLQFLHGNFAQEETFIAVIVNALNGIFPDQFCLQNSFCMCVCVCVCGGESTKNGLNY